MPLNSGGTGSELVSKLKPDPDPVLARKKAPSIRSERQPLPKAKPAPSKRSPVEKDGPPKKARK